VIAVGVVRGFVIDQFSVTLQLLFPAVIVQLPLELIPPDMTLSSEQDALDPPFAPLHVQVQLDVLFELLVLEPALQL
jgi:hypothetical protein